jgi:hypothetical protein
MFGVLTGKIHVLSGTRSLKLSWRMYAGRALRAGDLPLIIMSFVSGYKLITGGM